MRNRIRTTVTVRLSDAEALLEARLSYCASHVPGIRRVSGGPVICGHPGGVHRSNDNACMECRCDGFGSRSDRDNLITALSALGLEVAS